MAYFPVASTEQKPNARVPPLENGDRLDQRTFHERYESTADHVRAELIGGIVYLASPQKIPHSRTTLLVGRWLDEYEERTPGTEMLAGATDIMGSESQPEPDHCLFVLPAYGGRVRVNRRGYLTGAPEPIVETRRRPSRVTSIRRKTIARRRASANTLSSPCGPRRFSGSFGVAGNSRRCGPGRTVSFARRLSPACGSIATLC